MLTITNEIMNIENSKKIYMLGIKGVGMTMLAQYLKTKGVEVTGSDTDETFMTDKVLANSHIKVLNCFNPKNIPTDIDLAIYSTAYRPETNEELAKLLDSKIKTLTYAEALGEVFNTKEGIAVCGSHGKTTVSAWLGYVLDKCGIKPNVMVGAQVPQFDGNILINNSNYLIIEADEYQNKLKHFNPKGCLLNNIDYDHPDFFKTREDYNQAFIDFIARIPKKGFLIANFDDEIITKIANVSTKARIISYALHNKNADFIAKNIRQDKLKQYFSVTMNGDDLGEFSILLSGEHNIYNALAVIATAIEMEAELAEIRKHLEDFRGAARRMEVLGKYNGAKIIDDYAHHPTEIKATLRGIKEIYNDKNIICVFHPHTYTRTKGMLDDYGKCFSNVNELIVLDIYGSAREEQGGVHSRDIIKVIEIYNQKNNIKQSVKYIGDLLSVEDYLRKKIGLGDLVILMGAGDVFRIGERLMNPNSEKL